MIYKSLIIATENHKFSSFYCNIQLQTKKMNQIKKNFINRIDRKQ
jgi:hypothetical protein